MSFFSIAAIAFDRFYAIVRASVRTENQGLRYALIYCFVWSSAFLVSAPIFFGSDVFETRNDDGKVCAIKERVKILIIIFHYFKYIFKISDFLKYYSGPSIQKKIAGDYGKIILEIGHVKF